MGRRSRPAPLRPSLFPFLSVLVCMIGGLMFLAIAVTPSSLLNASANVEIEIDLGHVKHHKNPIILECSADTAKVWEGAQSFNLAQEKNITIHGPWRGTQFTDYLNELSKKEKEKYILFLLRPDGLEIFKTLRNIIFDRSQALGTNTISIIETPKKTLVEQFPETLRNKLRFEKGKLTFSQIMLPNERDAIKSILTKDEAKTAVDRLYEKSQTADWIDYGVELVPAGLKIRALHEKTALPVPPAVKGETP